MAQTIEVKGTTTILTDAVLADTFVALGITDHDDTASLETTNHEDTIHTNESGPEMPEKVINLGLTGKVRANLIRWDETQLAALVKATSAVSEGQIGLLGADKKTFAVKVQGTISGSKSYTYPFCKLSDPYTSLDWGNKASRMSLSIDAYPDPAALDTAATPLYTVATIA